MSKLLNLPLGSDFKVSPKLIEEMIDAVIQKYSTDDEFEYGSLRNCVSPIYKLFAYLKDAKNDSQKILFYHIFYGIYLEKFSPEDIIRYHINLGINISDDSLTEFLEYFVNTDSDIYRSYKKETIRLAFNELLFQKLDNYFEQNYGKEQSDYKVTYLNYLEEANIANTALSFRVIPKIDPTDTKDVNSYSSYTTAIADYFRLEKLFLKEFFNLQDDVYYLTEVSFSEANTRMMRLGKDYGIKDPEILNLLNYVFNTGYVSDSDINVPEPFMMYFPSKSRDHVLYNRPEYQKHSKAFQIICRNQNLYIDREMFDQMIEQIITNIMNAIDDHNADIQNAYISIGNSIYDLEVKLRELQVPQNIFTFYNEGVSEFVSDVKNLFVSLFSKSDQTSKTKWTNVFNSVSYVYGVDFIFNGSSIGNISEYKTLFNHNRDIYLIDNLVNELQYKDTEGESIYNINSIKNNIVPLQYGLTFTAEKFIDNRDEDFSIKTTIDTIAKSDLDSAVGATIYVNKSAIVDKYIPIIDEYIKVLKNNYNNNSPETDYQKVMWYTQTIVLRQLQEWYSDLGIEISGAEDVNVEELTPENIFVESPNLWKEGSDFESESAILSYSTLNSDVPDDAYYRLKIYVNDSTVPYRRCVSIDLGIGKTGNYFYEFSYLKTYSFFKSKDNSSIAILATDDYGSENVRSLYNLTEYVSYDSQRFYQSSESQKNLTNSMNVVSSTITKAVNTTFKAVTNFTNKVDDFFKNIGDGIVSVVDNVGDSLDFIPGRVREGVRTDDFLKKLISQLWTQLEAYKENLINYNKLIYTDKAMSETIMNGETTNGDRLSPIYLDSALYDRLVIQTAKDTVKNMYIRVANRIDTNKFTTIYDKYTTVQHGVLAATVGTKGKNLFPVIDTNIEVDSSIFAITDLEARDVLKNYLLTIGNVFAIFNPEAYADAFENQVQIDNSLIGIRMGSADSPGLIDDFDRFLKIIEDFSDYLVKNGHFDRNRREV